MIYIVICSMCERFVSRALISASRTEPVVGWGQYTGGLKEKGRPAGTFKGKDTPGPQYQLDRRVSRVTWVICYKA